MRYEGALWAAGLDVLGTLRAADEAAYFVGGCVRDALLGREAHDVDIATSAAPDKVLALFPGALPTGLKHGTVTVRRAGFFFEVTTFRQEAGYSDGRRPDEVSFVKDIREDLARRDFTINALAAGEDGVIVDPFGGIDDLQRRTLRTVGEAALRFGEDALRMVRCVRFAAEFGFAVDESAWSGLLACRDKLGLVAMERIGAELDKMCAGRDPGRAFWLLLAAGLPERFKTPLPAAWLAGLRRRIAEAAEAAGDEGRAAGGSGGMPGEPAAGGAALAPFVPTAEADLRWAALLLAGGAGPEAAGETLRRLHFAVRRAQRAAALIGLHEAVLGGGDDCGGPAAACRRRWTLAVLDSGAAAAADWLRLFAEARVRAAFGVPEPLHKAAAGWLAAMPATTIAGLAVRGDELRAASGQAPGPWIAAALRALLERVALGEVPNDRNALLEAFAALRKEG